MGETRIVFQAMPLYLDSEAQWRDYFQNQSNVNELQVLANGFVLANPTAFDPDKVLFKDPRFANLEFSDFPCVWVECTNGTKTDQVVVKGGLPQEVILAIADEVAAGKSTSAKQLAESVRLRLKRREESRNTITTKIASAVSKLYQGPLAYLPEAIKQSPFMRYALAGLALAGVVAAVIGYFRTPELALFAVIAGVAVMILIVIFGKVASAPTGMFARPVRLLVWAVTLLMVLWMVTGTAILLSPRVWEVVQRILYGRAVLEATVSVSSKASFVLADTGDVVHLRGLAAVDVDPGQTLFVDKITGGWTHDRYAGYEQALTSEGARIDVRDIVEALLRASAITQDGHVVSMEAFQGVIEDIWKKEYVDKGIAEDESTSEHKVKIGQAAMFRQRMMSWVEDWLAPRIQMAVEGYDTSGAYTIEVIPSDFALFQVANRAVWKRYSGENPALCQFNDPPPKATLYGCDGQDVPVLFDSAFPDRTKAKYCLLAQTGPGQFHKVRESWQWTNDGDQVAHVRFGMNDDFCGDNEGELYLETRVQP